MARKKGGRRKVVDSDSDDVPDAVAAQLAELGIGGAGGDSDDGSSDAGSDSSDDDLMGSAFGAGT